MPFPARSFEECHKIMQAPGQPWELTTTEIRGRKTNVYKNAPPSLRAIWLGCRAYGDRDYVVYEGERYTFEQAHVKVQKLAFLLYHSYGVRQGDRVAICARNLPEWIWAQWATQLLGGVTVAVNAWLPTNALIHCLTYATPRVVFLDAERAAVLRDKAEELNQAGGTSKILVIRQNDNLPKGMLSYTAELQKFEKEETRALPDVTVLPEDVATIFFTSGTTGLPKGVIGSNRNFITNIINSLIARPRAALRRGEDLPPPDPAARKALMLGVPLFHATGNHSSLGVCTAMGFKVVMIYKWHLPTVSKLIVEEKVSSAGGMPFMATELVESVLKAGDHVLESVSWGGAPSGPNLPSNIVKKLGQATLPGQGYGATEVSSMATGVAGEDYVLRPTTAGLPTFVMELRIVDEKGKEVPTGQTGEILMRGVSVTYGYWRSAKATAETFDSEGFYHSGDVGHVDEEGFLYISDRIKDIVIRGGENVSSVMVESEITRHSAVLDVAVVGVPHPKLGEEVAAAVVLKDGYKGKVKEQEIISFAAKTLPKHSVPRMIVYYEALPRNGVGKSDKRILREELKKVWLQKGLDAKL